MSEFQVSGAARVRFQQDLGSSWKDLADYFQVEPYVKARWRQGDEPSELWEFLRTRRRLGELREALADVGRQDLVDVLEAEAEAEAAARPGAGPRRRVVVAVAVAVALIMAAGLIGWWRSARDGTPSNYAKLPIIPSPCAMASGGTTARTQWPHTFPPSYVGDVYVQFTAAPRQTVDVRATLSWGGLTWTQTVPAMPGDMNTGVGGTMLVFQKRDADHGGSAPVYFETDVPVCADFGTVADAADAKPGLRLPTPHWR